jgi:hypothetical protein
VSLLITGTVATIAESTLEKITPKNVTVIIFLLLFSIVVVDEFGEVVVVLLGYHLGLVN